MKLRCPRCKAALSNQSYEGHDIHFCPGCFGHWLTRDQLTDIVSKVEYKFSKKTEQRIVGELTQYGDESRIVNEAPAVCCPECSREMTRQSYSPGCPVKIDECSEHGIWLDTGEIKDLQVYIERHFETNPN